MKFPVSRTIFPTKSRHRATWRAFRTVKPFLATTVRTIAAAPIWTRNKEQTSKCVYTYTLGCGSLNP